MPSQKAVSLTQNSLNPLKLSFSAAFLKDDKKRDGDTGDDLMARASPDPRFGSMVELSGRDASGLLNLIRVGETLTREAHRDGTSATSPLAD